MSHSLCLHSIFSALLVAVVLSNCSHGSDRDNAKSAAPGMAQTVASTGAATSTACKLPTRDEVAAALGPAGDEGKNYSTGGCEWHAEGDYAMQVVKAGVRDWEPLAKSAGGEAVPGIGRKASLAPVQAVSAPAL